jgi:hypothetical protein
MLVALATPSHAWLAADTRVMDSDGSTRDILQKVVRLREGFGAASGFIGWINPALLAIAPYGAAERERQAAALGALRQSETYRTVAQGVAAIPWTKKLMAARGLGRLLVIGRRADGFAGTELRDDGTFVAMRPHWHCLAVPDGVPESQIQQQMQRCRATDWDTLCTQVARLFLWAAESSRYMSSTFSLVMLTPDGAHALPPTPASHFLKERFVSGAVFEPIGEELAIWVPTYSNIGIGTGPEVMPKPVPIIPGDLAVKNGGFEQQVQGWASGTHWPAFWYPSNSIRVLCVTNIVRTGTFALRFLGAIGPATAYQVANERGRVEADGIHGRLIGEAEAGAWFGFEAAVWAASPSSNLELRIALDFYDVTLTLLSSPDVVSWTSADPAAWTKRYGAVKSPSGASAASMRLYSVSTDGAATSGDYYVDDVTDVAISMPRSMIGII